MVREVGEAEYALALAPTPSLEVLGTRHRFAVNRTFRIARNSTGHAMERDRNPDRGLPFFFPKPPTAVSTACRFADPPLIRDVHNEVEVLGVGALHRGDRLNAHLASIVSLDIRVVRS